MASALPKVQPNFEGFEVCTYGRVLGYSPACLKTKLATGRPTTQRGLTTLTKEWRRDILVPRAEVPGTPLRP